MAISWYTSKVRTTNAPYFVINPFRWESTVKAIIDDEKQERPYPIDRCDTCGTSGYTGYGRCCTLCIVKYGREQAPLMYRLLESSRQEAWERVDELQKRGSALENERRMWKSRATACRKLIDALLESAINAYVPKHEDVGSGASNHMAEIVERIWTLEHDAWTQTTQAAKTFVREIKGIMQLNEREPDPDRKILAFAHVVDSTYERFKAIVGED